MVLIALAVLTCVLWWRSKSKIDDMVLFVGPDGRAQVMASGRGRVCIALTNIPFGRERAWTAMCNSTPGELPGVVTDGLDVTRIQIYPPADPAKVATGGSPFGDGYLGFTFATSRSDVFADHAGSQLVYALIPHWAVAIPLVFWVLHRLFGPAAERQRRLRKGQCVHCGYDLRASAERCPECGAEIGQSERAEHATEPATEPAEVTP
jgi:hypothetical protein